MANMKLIQIAIFVLVLMVILSQHEMEYVEGRHLGLGRDDHKTSLKPKEKSMNHQDSTKQKEDEVDNFRPTNPGHSPEDPITTYQSRALYSSYIYV
ncbi:putative encoded peptide [Senna tora]|uniref:Putative encoded peptide n=1 Tax=Senna tora TaxID=362788 RepID=A0A834WAC7_9FABA|nr:putative encoded peptide [Senna tora]